MLFYVVRLLVAVVPVALMVTLIVFTLIHAAPGDPLALRQQLPPLARHHFRRR